MLGTQQIWVAPLKQIALLAITSGLAFTTLPGEAQEAPNACDLLPKISVPEQDRPTLAQTYSADVTLPKAARNSPLPGEPQATSACYAVSLYYSHGPNHFQKARYCVLARLGLVRGTVEPAKIKLAQNAASGGATEPKNIDDMSGMVLAMLYGNGEGVAPNLPLARQFICEYSGGIAGEEPVQHLEDFNKIVIAGGHFDVCDDGGDGFGREASYVCLGLQQDKRAQDIGRLEVAVAAASTPKMKASFLALRSAWRAFHDAYGIMDGDICDGGTGCGPITEGDDLTMTASWVSALKDIQEGKAPALGINRPTFTQVERNLNTKYQERLNEFKDCETQNCFATQVRDADRAWLKYREAWVRFGALRWPAIPADQWRAWQAVEWTSLLSGN
jgi:hypothetical protein